MGNRNLCTSQESVCVDPKPWAVEQMVNRDCRYRNNKFGNGANGLSYLAPTLSIFNLLSSKREKSFKDPIERDSAGAGRKPVNGEKRKEVKNELE